MSAMSDDAASHIYGRLEMLRELQSVEDGRCSGAWHETIDDRIEVERSRLWSQTKTGRNLAVKRAVESWLGGHISTMLNQLTNEILDTAGEMELEVSEFFIGFPVDVVGLEWEDEVRLKEFYEEVRQYMVTLMIQSEDGERGRQIAADATNDWNR